MLLQRVFTILYILILFNVKIFGLNTPSWMPRIFIKKEQERSEKKYNIDNNASFKIHNIKGSITIKEANDKQFIVESTKHGTADELNTVETIVKIKPNEINIYTTKKDDTLANIDLIITVAKDSNIKSVQSDDGDIVVENFSGKIDNITIDKGNLKLVSPGDIRSININKGNIVVNNPKINLQNIIVNKGNIEIFDSIASVIAKTNTGNIKIKQKIFKEPNTIFLETNKGNVNLSLPTKLQAHIRFRTLKGIINSIYPITFKSVTMKLNDDSWGQLKKNIEGIIGNGGAPITIDIAKGNISLDIY